MEQFFFKIRIKLEKKSYLLNLKIFSVQREKLIKYKIHQMNGPLCFAHVSFVYAPFCMVVFHS